MGEITRMTDREYFALDAIDQTALKKSLESPREYAYYMRHREEETDYFAFGKAAHSIVLGSGPHVEKRPDRRTKEGKALAARLAEQYGDDLVLLSGEDYEKLTMLAANAPGIADMGDGQPEVALLADDPVTGLPLKGKADWLPAGPDEDGVFRIVDYKTTGMNSRQLKDPYAFARAARDYGYHIQAAFYMMLYRLCTGYPGEMGFRFIVQQKNPPYDWVVRDFMETQPEIQQIAAAKIRHALSALKWWRDRGMDMREMEKWGLDKTPMPIEFKDWQLIAEEEEMNEWA